MIDLENLVRTNVKYLEPYSSARDEFHEAEGIFMDANENPYGHLNRYPDPYQKELKSSLSRIKGVPEENIFLGNGSDEIIDLCFRIFCEPGRDKALIFPPTYGMYEVSAAINDADLIKIPLDKDFNIPVSDTIPWLSRPELKLIFICSPNNPTGNAMNYGSMELIISNFRGIVVIDEAYNDFSGKPSFKNMTAKYPNIIVMQTFSKALGMAAARIGMAFSDPSVIHYFNKMKPPYNISTINQKAALERLRHEDVFKNQVKRIISERERLSVNLKKMNIIEKVFPSDSNFLLAKTGNAEKVYSYLVQKKIVVRNRDKLIPGCIRITVGTKSENNKLLKALRSIDL
jgi:histidinol-phosphate aminotransferase